MKTIGLFSPVGFFELYPNVWPSNCSIPSSFVAPVIEPYKPSRTLFRPALHTIQNENGFFQRSFLIHNILKIFCQFYFFPRNLKYF